MQIYCSPSSESRGGGCFAFELPVALLQVKLVCALANRPAAFSLQQVGLELIYLAAKAKHPQQGSVAALELDYFIKTLVEV